MSLLNKFKISFKGSSLLVLGGVLLGSILGLSGCSYFTFESNVDPKGISEYFSVAGIKSYTDDELMDLNYEELGTVEGIDCRIDENSGSPRTADAREDARKQAAARGANGIVYSKCVHFENTPACAQSVTCYGRMVYVKED